LISLSVSDMSHFFHDPAREKTEKLIAMTVTRMMLPGHLLPNEDVDVGMGEGETEIDICC